jgi:ArsR family transcriptional regulator, nickel/cobalt-responsive transcriptional repressor
MTKQMSRSEAADACLAVMDTTFFKALCEPARLEVVRRLIKLGRADVGEIAEGLPQDRSVVSRHLAVLEQAGIAFSDKEGRRVLYELDGPAMLQKLEGMSAIMRSLQPMCCPGGAKKSKK